MILGPNGKAIASAEVEIPSGGARRFTVADIVKAAKRPLASQGWGHTIVDVSKAGAQQYLSPQDVAKGLEVSDADARSIAAVIGSNGAMMANDDLYWFVYRSHPWVATCVDTVARSVATESYMLSANEGDDADTDLSDSKHAKDIQTFFQLCWGPKSNFRRERARVAVDYNVFGKWYWRKKRMPNGFPIFLERVDPRNVTLVLNNAKTVVKGYKIARRTFSSGGIGATGTGQVEYVDAKDMIVGGNGIGDPLFGGLSPLEKLDLTTATDLLIRRHRNSFFRNGAQAGTILVNKTGNKEQVEATIELIRESKEGADNAYSTLFLIGEWDVESVARAGDSDGDFLNSSNLNKEEIFGVYGVPLGIYDNKTGALGQAGKGADAAMYHEQAVLPVEEAIYDALTLSVLAEEFDVLDIIMTPKRRAAIRYDRIDAAMKMVQMGATGNEARVAINLPEVDKVEKEGDMDKPLFISSKNPLAQQEAGGDDPAADPAADPKPKGGKK